MPVDSRRVRGPEEGSQSPALYAVRDEEEAGEKALRVGRGPAEQRALYVRAGVLSQAAGSAFVEAAGGSKVVCGVWWGSGEGRLQCDLRWARFSSRAGRADRGVGAAQLLQESLRPAVCMERYPRAELLLSALVLEDRGSALPLAVTAASLAMADAGIHMYDLVLGASACRSPAACPPLPLLLDPGEAEEEAASGTVCVSLMPNLNQVSGLLCSGEWEGDSAAEAMKLCMEGCQRLYPLLQQSLLKSTKKKVPAPGPESGQPS